MISFDPQWKYFCRKKFALSSAIENTHFLLVPIFNFQYLEGTGYTFSIFIHNRKNVFAGRRAYCHLMKVGGGADKPVIDVPVDGCAVFSVCRFENSLSSLTINFERYVNFCIGLWIQQVDLRLAKI